VNSDLRIGIIGFGRIGNEHAAWLRDATGMRAVAAADPTPARRELAIRVHGLAVFDSEKSLLEHDDVDAVLVSSPTSMHFEHAMLALSARKHVMVEKPVTLNLADAKRLMDEAHKRSRTISVFHNRRWDIDYLTFKCAVASGIFGRIINIESRLGQWASCIGPAAKEWHPSWRNEAAYGGGGLYDWGSHFVDQLWQLMLPAKPVRVFAQLRGNVWTTDCDDFARVTVDFDNGAVGLCEINTTTARPLPRWHIDGTSGSAESPYSLEFDTNEWAKLEFCSPDGSSHILNSSQRGLTAAQIWERFAAACRDEAVEPAVTMSSVLTTMSLLDAARQSSQSGHAVQLR
jgi:predicted dehydrogenase